MEDKGAVCLRTRLKTLTRMEAISVHCLLNVYNIAKKTIATSICANAEAAYLVI